MKIKITSLGSSGEGVGSLDGLKVFVEGALPGETVEVSILQRKKTYAIGKLESVLEKSHERIQAPCPYFDRCGGCHIQHLSAEGQLKAKRRRVFDALTRIGKIEDPQVMETFPSPLPFHYRNKVQLPISETLELGLYARGSHDIVPIDHCMIHCDIGEEIFKEIRPLIQEKGLRTLYIRSSFFENNALVTLVTDGTLDVRPLAKKIYAIENVVGVMENINTRKDNVILGNRFTCLEGRDYLIEMLNGLKFKLSAASFFQVNPKQAEHLYQTALDFAELHANSFALDAYCGVGTLSLMAAKKASRVVGVEVVQDAIENAKENAALNEIDNCSFHLGSSESLVKRYKNVDTIFLNPPRKGCDRKVLEVKAKRLVYISCDPATLARDLRILIDNGYRLDAVSPIDMFPQTMHVETVCRLTGTF